MKAFFETYATLEKLAPLVREIGWSRNIVIIERCSDPLERELYIRMTHKFCWSKHVLIHYEYLVIVDAIRGGRVRERELAIKELKMRFGQWLHR